MDRRPDTVAAVDAEALQEEALAAVSAASALPELDEARVRYLGRKSDLKLALRRVRERETGMALNAVREAIEHAVESKQAELERAELDARLSSERVDVTLPAELLGPLRARPRGSLHPSTQVRRDVEDIFLGLGYEIVDGREVETTRYNFDALGFPSWHPSRSPRASLYLDDEHVLRTETSPGQIHKMEAQRPPIYMVSIGRVYRRDTIDATHFPIFHQFEGLAIDKGITMADLKGTLLYVMRQLYGPEREVRFRTHYFPFTEPSMEPDVSCFACGGAGCRICKNSGWIEMGGSGMVDPYLYEFLGWDPEEFTGFAFGMGIERTAQLRHGIESLRPFWENDLRFLRQF
jgi:phenylalanyl-tRNA synthetase alpha chain